MLRTSCSGLAAQATPKAALFTSPCFRAFTRQHLKSRAWPCRKATRWKFFKGLLLCATAIFADTRAELFKSWLVQLLQLGFVHRSACCHALCSSDAAIPSCLSHWQTHFTTCACTVYGRLCFLRGDYGGGHSPICCAPLIAHVFPRTPTHTWAGAADALYR